METRYLYPDPLRLYYENDYCVAKLPFASFHPDAEGFTDTFSDYNLGVAEYHKEHPGLEYEVPCT